MPRQVNRIDKILGGPIYTGEPVRLHVSSSKEHIKKWAVWQIGDSSQPDSSNGVIIGRHTPSRVESRPDGSADVIWPALIDGKVSYHVTVLFDDNTFSSAWLQREALPPRIEPLRFDVAQPISAPETAEGLPVVTVFLNLERLLEPYVVFDSAPRTEVVFRTGVSFSLAEGSPQDVVRLSGNLVHPLRVGQVEVIARLGAIERHALLRVVKEESALRPRFKAASLPTDCSNSESYASGDGLSSLTIMECCE